MFFLYAFYKALTSIQRTKSDLFPKGRCLLKKHACLLYSTLYHQQSQKTKL